MQTRVFLALTTLLLASANASFGGVTVRHSIDHDGRTRSYQVYVPDTYSAEQPAPVVLNLHGTRGTSAFQAATSRMNDVAEENGFLAVYPQAIMSTPSGVRWNHLQLPEQVNDVDFVGSVLDQVEIDFNVDLSRVYSTGFSNGGSMTHVLAHEFPDRLAAVAAVAGSIAIRDSTGNVGPIDPVSSPTTSRPLPIMIVSGTADVLVPFEGGASPLSGDLYPPVDDVVAAWLSNNGCLPDPAIRQLENIDSTDGSNVELHSFLVCDEYLSATGSLKAEVQLFKIIGGNHQWPGGASPSPLDNAALQPRNDDINASQEIWSFFESHQLPVTLPEPNSSSILFAAILCLAPLRTKSRIA